ncbi:uncharacterized protein LOC112493720 [Cephus cinctus]|uniref:Uncharacterized protein LOC112493720 n=1 Tax=Cephus cinctus TaxID=211228 RepID=A0AAJ7R913_CEPCN|nr:uncharacterized protein LOC112493720 [Cephus cinctus]
MVVEGIALCNSACITCIWCILLSVFCPRFMNNLKQVDSSVCCMRKPKLKKKFSKIFNNRKSKDISRKSRNSSDFRSLNKYKNKRNQKSMSVCQRNSEIDNGCSPRHFNGKDISGNYITKIKDPVEIDISSANKRNDTNLITVEKSKNQSTTIDDKTLEYYNDHKEDSSHLNFDYKIQKPIRRYKLYTKLSRRSSDSGEHFLVRRN